MDPLSVALKVQGALQGTFLSAVEARLAQGVALLSNWNVVEPVAQGGCGPQTVARSWLLPSQDAIFVVF